ncbi:hypothetical protein ACR77J_15975 [Tissierella praeacuta]|uniref:DUF4875 domain-containing protein n=1 Tax=Tissierella praeacuta TaxID=43131 RepID=UPI003DA61A15
MSNKIKRLLFIVIILACAIMAACESEEAAKIRDISYRIVEKNDISFGGTYRFSLDVVIDDKVSLADMETLSKEIIKNAKKEDNFNAISINFYDYEEYVGKGYTLGKVEYAPEGEWSKANTVRAGDYKNMDYSFDLREKNWEKQLNRSEVEVYKAWKELYTDKDKGSFLPDEDEITKEIAEEFNITAEEVKGIMLKQIEWTFNDKNN